MILAEARFGSRGKHEKDELEDLVQSYLASMLRNGQLCGKYFFAWIKGVLTAHIVLAGPSAHLRRHHSRWGKEDLRKVVETFGREPCWVMLDDETPKRSPSWKSAPFLYLHANMLDWAPPVRRGDNGEPIPSYLLPVTDLNRDHLYSWARSYQDHERVWIASGTLEIPAYRELANPGSRLPQEGLSLCRAIEKATDIPMYYYMKRYWGRRQGEESRKCPGCGRRWATGLQGAEDRDLWEFDFRCDDCRLVSHVADAYDDERHARIGEYRPRRKGRRRKR